MNHHKQKQKVSDPTLAAWQSQVKQSYKKPWLSIIMREHQPILFSRFSHFYDQIRALPRWTRRRLKRKLGMTFAGAALMLALSRAAVQANSIAVVDGEVGINANGLCSLVEAIENANDTSSDLLHADCAAGDPTGADIINLPTNGSFTLTAVYGSTHYGANGLPDISSQITIEGNGSTIERDSGAPSFRILAVAQLGELTLNEATISGADKSGMQNLGILTVNNTVISDNTGDTGGGIENFSDLTINNSTISSNTGGLGGGVSHFQGFGCFDEFTETIINNSTISGNAGWFGGGVVEFNFGCYDGAFNMTINNSTISGNSASYAGGGVFHYSAYSDDVLTISNSTITGNSASSRGGGVFSRWAETIINRSIISGNVAPEDREIHGIIDSTYNLLGYSGDSGVSFPLSPSDIVPAEALSDILDTALLHNGGSTATHALVPGSPAIDASPADADCLVTDQRGLARPQGAACDIGAFEFVSAGTLYDDVQELVDDKTLAPQQGRPLIWLLRQTHRLIQREQFGKATMNLNNFINTINRFIDMGALTPAEGQPLIDSTQALIDSLTP